VIPLDEKQKRSEAHNVLIRYRSLRRIRSNDELDKINSAVKKLSEIEKTIINRKYIQIDEWNNIKISTSMFISESSFYRKLNKALAHFHEIYFN